MKSKILIEIDDNLDIEQCLGWLQKGVSNFEKS